MSVKMSVVLNQVCEFINELVQFGWVLPYPELFFLSSLSGLIWKLFQMIPFSAFSFFFFFFFLTFSFAVVKFVIGCHFLFFSYFTFSKS